MLRANQEKKASFCPFTTAESIKLFITQCIFVYIECHHQVAFISWCLSQVASFLFALNKYSNSLRKNLRIILEDVFTFIHTSRESRILLSVLLQLTNEYQKIISLIANSCTVVTPDSLILSFLIDYFYFDYQRTDFYTQFILSCSQMEYCWSSVELVVFLYYCTVLLWNVWCFLFSYLSCLVSTTHLTPINLPVQGFLMHRFSQNACCSSTKV